MEYPRLSRRGLPVSKVGPAIDIKEGDKAKNADDTFNYETCTSDDTSLLRIDPEYSKAAPVILQVPSGKQWEYEKVSVAMQIIEVVLAA